MNGLKQSKGCKHISDDSAANDKFLTEKQRSLVEYHFAVIRSLGLPEYPHEKSFPIRSGSETEDSAHK